MPVTTLTSREFNQDTARAKRAARNGPVFITDRGRPSHVLLTIEDFEARGPGPSIAEALHHPASAHIDFDPPRLGDMGFKTVDFS